MGRNATTTFYNLPNTNKPRNKFKFPVSKTHLTAQHGRITPFLTQIVYPGDTFKIDSNIFARADISSKVPLDDVIVDIYYFYVPFRIIDPDFYKAAGGTDEPYDDTAYSFPQVNLVFNSYSESSNDEFTSFADNLPFYLGYGQAIGSSQEFESLDNDVVCAYPIAAYWKIFNEFFRDENLDPSMPYEQIYDDALSFDVGDAADGTPEAVMGFTARANRIRDYFSTAMLSPQKGPNVTLPLGTSAPIIGTNQLHPLGASLMLAGEDAEDPTSGSLTVGTDGLVYIDDDFEPGTEEVQFTNLMADLSKASAASINQFRISLAMQAWYEERGMYGTRPQEQLLQWGITAPDGLLQRPEYLGGISTTLNALPVLNTASDTTKMSGQAATIFNDGGFEKSFIEAGVILGLVLTRVKHEYSQGIDPTIWKLKTDLDMYHPLFANIGFMPIYKYELYNTPGSAVTVNGAVFGYTEAWQRLRCHPNRTAGLFNPTLGEFANTDLHSHWCYQDIYDTRPYLSREWLKEMPTEVMRTMTGNLITNATGNANVGESGTPGTPCHQYMFGFYTHFEKVAILPPHSMPNNFGMGRI